VFFGKGYSISESETINVGIDYLDYKQDPRNVEETYKRITSSIRYNNKLEFNNNAISLNANVDYTGSFDYDNIDNKIYSSDIDSYSKSYNKLRLSGSLKWDKIESEYFKGLNLRFTSSYTNDIQTSNKLVSEQGEIPWTMSRQEGEHDGIYLPHEFQASIKEDSKPVNIFVQLYTKIDIPVSEFDNELMIGFDYKYDKNYGKGELYNPNRPFYTTSSRPREYSDVPSQQRISFFVEDNTNILFGDYALNFVAGLRATKLLNLNSRYDISDKLFLEPRLNIKLSLPEFTLFNQNVELSINGGVGEHKKFPALIHLYPNNVYFDIIQLNYYHQQEAYRRVYYDTHIVNPTNYSISEATNRKLEIGIDLNVNGNSFSVTAFRENLSSGYKRDNRCSSFINKKYDGQSIDYNSLTDKPRIEDMTFVLDTNLYQYTRYGNGKLIVKKGIEFQFDFKRFESLYTKLTINGAWFKTTYSDSRNIYFLREEILNGKLNSYFAEYTGGSDIYERLNTNFRFDTQIPSMGLVFSSLFECVWFNSTQKERTDHNPISYIDKSGIRHSYSKESEEDYRLKCLVLKNNVDGYKKVEPFAAYVNLKVTKKFNKNISIAMYVNRLITYLPSYSIYDYDINRRSSPYFGMELRINLGGLN